MENFWQDLPRPIVALAPMAGITDQPFRQICKGYGADLVYSEMASASAIFFNKKKTLGLVRFNKKESPYVVQLFGSTPEHFRFAAKIIAKQIRPDGLDINFGCPAKKVIACGSGAVLMNDMELSRKIIMAALEGVGGRLPVSLKIRAGVKGVAADKFVEAVRDLPVSAIMIHGRTLEQLFSGPVDYSMIKKVKSLVNIPVIANGGIMIPEDAERMLRETNADGVGIAQGALGQPWIFWQIKDYFAGGKYERPDFDDIKKAAILHAELMKKKKGKQGVLEMRKHLAWYFKGFSRASVLRQKLVHVKTTAEIKKLLDSDLPR